MVRSLVGRDSLLASEMAWIRPPPRSFQNMKARSVSSSLMRAVTEMTSLV